jgi:Cys-tRNA(Pro)/Cys-tRNA(Cys) deacylase
LRAKRAKATAGTPAVRLLEARGIAHTLHAYDFEPGDLGIGEQAAAALGIAPERIFKTLIAVIDEVRLVTALVPVHRATDLKALAAAAGGKRAAVADLRQAERATGYVKGGISPFGQRQRLPAVVDASIRAQPTVFVNGGRRGLQIELAPADLVTVLEAEVADIVRPAVAD